MKITSPMQHLLRPDAAKDTSGRNFRSILVIIKWASFASCTSLHKFIRFIEVTDTTSLGDGFDFAGWKIRLHWVEESISLAEWSGWSSRMKYLNKAIDVAEFSTISWLNFSMRFKNALKRLLPLQGVWGKTCESPASLYLFLQFQDFLQWKFGGCWYLLIRKAHWQKAASCG